MRKQKIKELKCRINKGVEHFFPKCGKNFAIRLPKLKVMTWELLQRWRGNMMAWKGEDVDTILYLWCIFCSPVHWTFSIKTDRQSGLSDDVCQRKQRERERCIFFKKKKNQIWYSMIRNRWMNTHVSTEFLLGGWREVRWFNHGRLHRGGRWG